MTTLPTGLATAASISSVLATLGVDPDAPATSLTALKLVETLVRVVHGPPPAPEPEWLPTREAARYCRVDAKTLRRWAAGSDVIMFQKGAGRAPSRYSRESLDTYMGGAWTPLKHAA